MMREVALVEAMHLRKMLHGSGYHFTTTLNRLWPTE